jgi:hypothetical protein
VGVLHLSLTVPIFTSRMEGDLALPSSVSSSSSSSSSSSTSASATTGGKRGPYTCALCGSKGHTRRTCLRNTVTNVDPATEDAKFEELSEEYINQVMMEELDYATKRKKKKLVFLDCDPGHDDFFASRFLWMCARAPCLP